MSHDEFTKLFRYMSKRFDEMEKRFDQMASKAEVDKIYTILDKIEKDNEINTHERISMSSILDRHDRWIHGIAEKTGYKLSA